VSKELEKEFSELIKEISKEVLELSITKSVESASFAIKAQVPTMSQNIEQLKKALESLQWVNAELIKNQEEVKARDTRIDIQLKNMINKLESNIRIGKDLQEDVALIREDSNRDFEVQVKMFENAQANIRGDVKKQIALSETQSNILRELVNENIAEGYKRKKILSWTLLFSASSFGMLAILLLHTLNVL